MPATDVPLIRVGGMDFGTTAVHAVVLSGSGERRPVVERTLVAMGGAGPDELAALCAGVSHVGIDAPDSQTAGCPLPGVRPARCAEVALAATHHGRPERLVGGPVSMLTPPAGAPFPARLAWMGAGFALWEHLRAHAGGTAFFETYPSGSFKRLAHAASPPLRLAPRGTAAGLAQRAALLRPLVDGPPYLDMWGLDAVDALAAAVAAYRVATGSGFVVAAHRHRGHDGSSITLIA